MPPDDDVVEHRPVGVVEEVRVLGSPGADLAEVVGERPLQPVEGVGALDAHRAEVGDVEHDGRAGGSEVLGDRAGRVLERHLPAAERHHPGAERPVDGVERRPLEASFATAPMAAAVGRGVVIEGDELGVDVVLDAGQRQHVEHALALAQHVDQLVAVAQHHLSCR